MINIQARAITDPLTSLVKQIDNLVGSAADKKAPNKAFVVLITDDPDGAAPQLEALANREGIENTPLTIFNRLAGPRGYHIAKEAEVTVMMWKKGTVEVNHAFRKGELDQKAVAQVVADAKKFLQ